MYYSQSGQDKFVLNVLNNKTNGFFVELGSQDPIEYNNSYVLESEYKWKGIMIEYEHKHLPAYIEKRPNSIHIINDARNIDYNTLFKNNNVPHEIDYLQIDLEPLNGSTLEVLQKIDQEILADYKFATITFEHDIWRNYENPFIFEDTRNQSRQIFEKHGYIRVFDDVNNADVIYPYEDWYVHPDLVDMNYIETLIEKNINNYDYSYYANHNLIKLDKTIDYRRIEYL